MWAGTENYGENRQRNTPRKVKERTEETGTDRVGGPEAVEVRGSCNEASETDKVGEKRMNNSTR